MSDIQLKNTAAQPTATAPKPAKPADKAQPKPGLKDKPKPKPKATLQPLQSYIGTVGTYGANPDGIYDKLTLETAGPTYTVKFPPHFGQELQALAQPGQLVTVLGFLKTTPKGDEHLHLARVAAGGASARPLPPAASAADVATVVGIIAELHHDPKGHLHSLHLVGDATELRLPPHLGEQLAERLVVGAAIEAGGRRRTLRPGEVAAPDRLAPLHIELLTLGPDAFLLH